MSPKIKLEPARYFTPRGSHPHFYSRPVSECLPFYRSGSQNARVHRVRTAEIHYRLEGDAFRYISVKLWCGNLGFVGGEAARRRTSLLAIAPEHSVFCAACEGKAIGAGLDGARVINGRPVIFTPRL